MKPAKLMEKVPIPGEMEKSMMENGKKARSKDMESGTESKVTAISDNGLIAEQKDMVFILGSMEIGMKASGRSACVMAMVPTFLQMAICMLVSTRKADLMALDSTSGLMVIHTRETFTLGRNTDRESGKKLHQIFKTKITLINLKGTMKWIRNMDLESSFGNQETNIRAITMEMKDKGMEL